MLMPDIEIHPTRAEEVCPAVPTACRTAKCHCHTGPCPSTCCLGSLAVGALPGTLSGIAVVQLCRNITVCGAQGGAPLRLPGNALLRRHCSPWCAPLCFNPSSYALCGYGINGGLLASARALWPPPCVPPVLLCHLPSHSLSLNATSTYSLLQSLFFPVTLLRYWSHFKEFKTL